MLPWMRARVLSACRMERAGGCTAARLLLGGEYAQGHIFSGGWVPGFCLQGFWGSCPRLQGSQPWCVIFPTQR